MFPSYLGKRHFLAVCTTPPFGQINRSRKCFRRPSLIGSPINAGERGKFLFFPSCLQGTNCKVFCADVFCPCMLISRGTQNGLEAAVYGLAYLHSFPDGRYGGRSQVLCSNRASASIDCRMSYHSHCTLDLDTMDIGHYIHSDRHTHYMLCRLQIEGIAR